MNDEGPLPLPQGSPPPSAGWFRRIAGEGSIGRRVVDSVIGLSLLATVVTGAVNASGANAVPTSGSGGGLVAGLAEPSEGLALSEIGMFAAAPAASLTGATLPVGAEDARAITVTFGCDVPASHTCGFTLFSGSTVRQTFGLRGGTRAQILALPGIDRYIVAVDSAAPQALDQCPRFAALGHFCKVATVQRGYNS